MADLEEMMRFDPDDGIADLDDASRPAEERGRSARLQVRPPRRAQRAPGRDLRQAPPGDRAAAAVADRGDGDRGPRGGLGGEREAQQPVGHRDQRRRVGADRAEDFRMMGVEPAGQRAERGHDELGRRQRRSSAARRGGP